MAFVELLLLYRYLFLYLFSIGLAHSSTPIVSTAAAAAAVASTSEAPPPWYEVESTHRRPRSPFGDLPPNTFAPNGRLYDIEDFSNAVYEDDDPSSNSVIVMLCRDGIVAVTSVPCSPYRPDEIDELDDESSTMNTNSTHSSLLLDIDNMGVHPTAIAPFARVDLSTLPILALTAGNAVDAQLLRLRLHSIVNQLRPTRDSIHAATVARRLADQNQLRTLELQHGRLLAAAALIWTHDALWRVDPAGQFWSCQASVVGRYTTRIEQRLRDALVPSLAIGTTARPMRRQTLAALSNLTVAEGLAVATRCLLETYESILVTNQRKNRRRQNGDGPSAVVRLRAITMVRSSETKTSQQRGTIVQSYSHQDLVAMLESLR